LAALRLRPLFHYARQSSGIQVAGVANALRASRGRAAKLPPARHGIRSRGRKPKATAQRPARGPANPLRLSQGRAAKLPRPTTGFAPERGS